MINFKDESRKIEFANRLIYTKQFNGDAYRAVFHIVNTFYPIMNGDYNRLTNIVRNFITNKIKADQLLTMVLDKYAPNYGSMFRYDCFTEIDQHLTDDEMYFMQSGKRRLVTLREYKFLLKRITKNVYNSDGCKSILTNSYFHGEGIKEEYKKYAKKSFSSHKLTHILQIVQKHHYLHISYNSRNQRVVQIGPNNPFYLIDSVPDIEEQDVATKTDRMIARLTSENKVLQTAVDLLREELAEAHTRANTLGGQIESLQQENKLMLNSLCERDEEIKQFTVVPDYKVEGSWATYNLKGYAPVRLSLN